MQNAFHKQYGIGFLIIQFSTVSYFHGLLCLHFRFQDIEKFPVWSNVVFHKICEVIVDIWSIINIVPFIFAGFQFVGMLQGFECHCSDSYGDFEQYEAECKTPCIGNKTQICGGNQSFSVYTSLSMYRLQPFRATCTSIKTHSYNTVVWHMLNVLPADML